MSVDTNCNTVPSNSTILASSQSISHTLISNIHWKSLFRVSEATKLATFHASVGKQFQLQMQFRTRLNHLYKWSQKRLADMQSFEGSFVQIYIFHSTSQPWTCPYWCSEICVDWHRFRSQPYTSQMARGRQLLPHVALTKRPVFKVRRPFKIDTLRVHFVGIWRNCVNHCLHLHELTKEQCGITDEAADPI